MSVKSKEVLGKDDTVQAIVVADTFGDEFVPISSDIPLALLPLINQPLIDYTLEFLSLGGIEETFLFCCSHVDAIKAHISKSIEEGVEWSLTMKVKIIVSESCHSFGDCLRDLDRKGLLRGTFVLLEPGTVSNIKLLPIIKKHNEIINKDKGAAMTLIFQEAGIGQAGRDPREEVLVAVNNDNRILFHRKLGQSKDRRIKFPLEIFLDNSCVSLRHNIKDTHIAICSPSVLPLFSDNFDFQTKDDFVKGLLMNEEILESTVYCHIIKGSNYGGAITSWRMYQNVSRELQNKWLYPLQSPVMKNCHLKNGVITGSNVVIKDNKKISKSIIGENVVIGKNVQIHDSFIFPNSKIENDVVITHSIIGSNCRIKSKSKITAGSILGENVIIDNGTFIENSLVQASEPENCDKKDKLGKNAFRLKIEDEDDELGVDLARKLSKLHISDEKIEESEDESDAFGDSEDEELSYTQSPLPDDTKLFFTEVIDSLTRGFEDELQCDNLILEINSSRYAYNVTVREVNFNVIKAILHMSLRLSTGPQYFSQFVRLLSYFAPILKNYIRNNSAMLDTLQATEDVAISNENINNKWVMFVLKWFYDKDYVTEDVILEWSKTLDRNSKFYMQVKPFTDWLEEAEEASSSDEESESAATITATKQTTKLSSQALSSTNMAEVENNDTKSEGFLTSIVLEILNSPLNIALVCLIAILVYKIIKSRQDVPTEKPEPELPKLKKRDFTVEELKKYDGTQEDGRVLVAVNGNVYDVTKGKRFYGPGGPYAAFGGKDASRGLATFSVSTKTDGYDDLSDLNTMEMDSVREWEAQFKEKYELVGRLLKPGEQPTNYSDEEDETPAAGGDKAKDE